MISSMYGLLLGQLPVASFNLWLLAGKDNRNQDRLHQRHALHWPPRRPWLFLSFPKAAVSPLVFCRAITPRLPTTNYRTRKHMVSNDSLFILRIQQEPGTQTVHNVDTKPPNHKLYQ